MNEELVSHLEDLGLSEKESRVYLANLSLGPSSVQKIADYAGIKRVTTYVILESLVNLGLASQSIKGKKTFFIAEDPVSLNRLISKREEELKDQKQNLETILPELKDLKSLPSESPGVRFYDSAEGIRSIMGSFLSQHKNEVDILYGVSNTDQLFEFFPEIAANLTNPDRVRTGVSSKVIYTSSKGALYAGSDKTRNRESRYVPEKQFPLKGDISIVGDHIVMLALSGSKPIGITIQSKELSAAMKAIFNLAWEAAKQYN